MDHNRKIYPFNIPACANRKAKAKAKAFSYLNGKNFRSTCRRARTERRRRRRSRSDISTEKISVQHTGVRKKISEGKGEGEGNDKVDSEEEHNKHKPQHIWEQLQRCITRWCGVLTCGSQICQRYSFASKEKLWGESDILSIGRQSQPAMGRQRQKQRRSEISTKNFRSTYRRAQTNRQ